MAMETFIVTKNVLWLFLTVPWVGLQCVIVVFPDHTHLLFFMQAFNKQRNLKLQIYYMCI